MKKEICPCHKIYREEAVGLKNSDYTSKNKTKQNKAKQTNKQTKKTIFFEYVKFGAIL